MESWYGEESVTSFDAPGVWERTERAQVPSSLQSVWEAGPSEPALPSLLPGLSAPALAVAAAAAAGLEAPLPVPAAEAKAQGKAAWGKLGAKLSAEAAQKEAAVTALAAALGGGGLFPAGTPPPPAPVLREQDRPGNTLCTFYLSGECMYGDFCRFRHVKPEPWAVEYFESLLLAKLEGSGGGEGGEEEEGEEQGGNGAGGGGGGSGGGSGAAAGQQQQLLPAEASEADFAASSRTWAGGFSLSMQRAVLQEAVDAGVSSDVDAAEVALAAAERGVSRTVECSVCLEVVVEGAAGRRFGLLTGCAHAFCLDCIRAWRARIDLPAATVRSCPVCRKLSYYVIPSDCFVADEARKASLVGQYHGEQKKVPCRNFEYGKGKCPFGSSCFYAHLVPDGAGGFKPYKEAKHVFRVTEEGIKGVGKAPKLSDFLFKS